MGWTDPLTSELVALRGGLTVPAEAFRLAHQLSGRGLVVTVDGDRLRVSGPQGTKPELSEAEIAGIRRWKPHLIALVTYEPPP